MSHLSSSSNNHKSSENNQILQDEQLYYFMKNNFGFHQDSSQSSANMYNNSDSYTVEFDNGRDYSSNSSQTNNQIDFD